MKKTKVAFFEVEPWEKEYLENKLKGFSLYFSEEKLTAKEAKELSDVDILSPFIYSKIDKNIINSMESLGFIATRSTGFDHIDLKTCGRNKILVSNVPHYGENTVAEHTFALILTMSRKMYDSVKRTKEGNFSCDGLRGFDLKGKTIGIVGLGSIGRHVARMANGFEMNILAFDLKKDDKFAKKVGLKYVTMEKLFANSDIVTFHVPYNKHTRHLVNMKTIKSFKKGCYLVNTSRGGVCDTTALLKGLEDGTFAGIGLDVLEEECFVKEEREILTKDFLERCDLKTILENNILIKRPNVVITPHNAFNSKEALMRILDATVENIKSFASKKPINLVK